MFARWLCLLFLALSCLPVQATPVSVLRDTEVAAALRQALEVGIGTTVTRIGQENGFLGNEGIRIPLPESLRKGEQLLRKFGLGKQADELVTTMNRAAEQAVPEARALLVGAARKLTIEDAKRILTGPPDAATQYFRTQSEASLMQRFLPIREP